jgi:hypothetical protein
MYLRENMFHSGVIKLIMDFFPVIKKLNINLDSGKILSSLLGQYMKAAHKGDCGSNLTLITDYALENDIKLCHQILYEATHGEGCNEIIKTHIYNYINRANIILHDIPLLELELYDRILSFKDLPGIRQRLDILMKEKDYGDTCMNLVLELGMDDWTQQIFTILTSYEIKNGELIREELRTVNKKRKTEN